MKIVYNNIIPFKGFYAINLFGILFVRDKKDNPISSRTINHESIHTAQMKEMGYIFFYIWYFIEWFIRLFINGRYAYYKLSFEQETYNNESNQTYLEQREPYAWFKYYLGRKR